MRNAFVAAALFLLIIAFPTIGQSAVPAGRYTHSQHLIVVEGKRRLNLFCEGRGTPVVLSIPVLATPPSSGARALVPLYATVATSKVLNHHITQLDRLGVGGDPILFGLRAGGDHSRLPLPTSYHAIGR